MSKKISDLTAAGSVAGADLIPIVQGGVTKKATGTLVFNAAFSAKTTADLSENTNLYYTAARFNTAFAAKTTADLTEGANLYYTAARFNTAFAAKTTDGLTEGTTNLYDTTLATGTRASPTSITAVGGITAGARKREMQFVVGSGGPVEVTANPQISAGTYVGQLLTLKGTDDTNTVQIDDGTGLELNGNYILKNKSQILLMWDGTIWGEVARNDL